MGSYFDRKSTEKNWHIITRKPTTDLPEFDEEVILPVNTTVRGIHKLRLTYITVSNIQLIKA